MCDYNSLVEAKTNFSSGKAPCIPDVYTGELRNLINNCMDPNPEKRPSAAGVLAETVAAMDRITQAGTGANPDYQKARDAFRLHRAVEISKIQELRSLLNMERNPELIDARAGSDGKCALHQAAKSDNLPATQLLLRHGAKVSALDNNRETSLHYAAARGSEKVVATLLNHGAIIHFDTRGWTAIYIAAAANHRAVLSELLRRHKQKVDEPSQDQKGLTPLHIAARNGCTMSLQDLLEAGADASKTTNDGAMAFHLGAENGHTEVLGHLLESRVNVNARGKDKLTALHLAAWNGHVETARFLLHMRAEVDPRNIAGETPFHCAARKGQPELLELLRESGADINAGITGDERRGWTALHLASSKGQESAVELLLERGAKVNWRNKDDDTALHHAAGHGNVAIARILLSKDQTDVNIKGRNRKAPLHWAALHGQTDMVDFLLRNKADGNQRTGSGNTALMLAAEKGHATTVEKLLNHTNNVDSTNAKGDTALHVATKAVHPKFGTDVVEALLHNGAKVDMKNHQRQTPLMCLRDGKKRSLNEVEGQIERMLQRAANSSN